MVHYYSRESKTNKGQFTIMEVLDSGGERLVCRTPRGDVAAHLMTFLNIQPLPQKSKDPWVMPKITSGRFKSTAPGTKDYLFTCIDLGNLNDNQYVLVADNYPFTRWVEPIATKKAFAELKLVPI